MYGAIPGDIIGSPFEFDRGNKTKGFEFFMPGSEYTDDTDMTIAAADVTHSHPEGIRGAEAAASAVFLARSGNAKKRSARILSADSGMIFPGPVTRSGRSTIISRPAGRRFRKWFTALTRCGLRAKSADRHKSLRRVFPENGYLPQAFKTVLEGTPILCYRRCGMERRGPEKNRPQARKEGLHDPVWNAHAD